MANGSTRISGHVVQTQEGLDCVNMDVGDIGIVVRTKTDGEVKPGFFVIASCGELVFFSTNKQDSWWGYKKANLYFYRKLNEAEYLTLTQASE